jgi:S-adenosylmethionine/arginine decarboxylase-like enzyme
VESWLVISTWPAHGFTRINLSSCKQFDHGAVTNYLSRIGEVVEDWQQKI